MHARMYPMRFVSLRLNAISFATWPQPTKSQNSKTRTKIEHVQIREI